MIKQDSNNDASLRRLADIQKQIMEYLSVHNYNWGLDESMMVNINGDTYIVSLLPKNTDYVTLHITYPIEPHAGAFLQSEECQQLYVNYLGSRYPHLSATLNHNEKVLLLEYEADICSVEEFDHHFKTAVYEIGFILEFDMRKLEYVCKIHFPQLLTSK